MTGQTQSRTTEVIRAGRARRLHRFVDDAAELIFSLRQAEAIVEALADGEVTTGMVIEECALCGEGHEPDGTDPEEEYGPITHKPTCIWLRARQYVERVGLADA